jgi:hypothetical protein
MAIACPRCGAEYDVTLFEFGRRIHCDCGSWVDLHSGHTLRETITSRSDSNAPRYSVDRTAEWNSSISRPRASRTDEIPFETPPEEPSRPPDPELPQPVPPRPEPLDPNVRAGTKAGQPRPRAGADSAASQAAPGTERRIRSWPQQLSKKLERNDLK